MAAALAFASAAVTLFWTLGGTLGLDTVGGQLEELARARSAGALLLGTVVVLAKVAAGLLATVSAGGGTLLALYGGVIVAAGALVLAGVINSTGEVDTYTLRWHAFLWDLWFLIWGLALGAAVLRAPEAGVAGGLSGRRSAAFPQGRRRLSRMSARRAAATLMGMSSEITAPPPMHDAPLSDADLHCLHAYWRAANDLSVGQIYLLDNPLLREPLTLDHIKPRLLGHWGTTPGLNFIYAHLNRLICARRDWVWPA